MGLLDKAKSFIRKNEDKIDKGLAKAGDLVDKRTGGKHRDKIDKAIAKAQDLTPDAGDEKADAPPEKDPPKPAT